MRKIVIALLCPFLCGAFAPARAGTPPDPASTSVEAQLSRRPDAVPGADAAYELWPLPSGNPCLLLFDKDVPVTIFDLLTKKGDVAEHLVGVEGGGPSFPVRLLWWAALFDHQGDVRFPRSFVDDETVRIVRDAPLKLPSAAIAAAIKNGLDGDRAYYRLALEQILKRPDSGIGSAAELASYLRNSVGTASWPAQTLDGLQKLLEANAQRYSDLGQPDLADRYQRFSDELAGLAVEVKAGTKPGTFSIPIHKGGDAFVSIGLEGLALLVHFNASVTAKTTLIGNLAWEAQDLLWQADKDGTAVPPALRAEAGQMRKFASDKRTAIVAALKETGREYILGQLNKGASLLLRESSEGLLLALASSLSAKFPEFASYTNALAGGVASTFAGYELAVLIADELFNTPGTYESLKVADYSWRCEETFSKIAEASAPRNSRDTERLFRWARAIAFREFSEGSFCASYAAAIREARAARFIASWLEPGQVDDTLASFGERSDRAYMSGWEWLYPRQPEWFLFRAVKHTAAQPAAASPAPPARAARRADGLVARYRVIEIPLLPGTTAGRAAGLNNRGHVIGTCRKAGARESDAPETAREAFLWKGGEAERLALPHSPREDESKPLSGETVDYESNPVAINDLDQVLLERQLNTGRPNDSAIAIMDGGTVRWVPTAVLSERDEFRRPLRIYEEVTPLCFNSRGQVAGMLPFRETDCFEGRFWNRSDRPPAKLPPLPHLDTAIPAAINASGVVAGESRQRNPVSSPDNPQPALWLNNAAISLAIPRDKGAYGGATGINERGTVCGYSYQQENLEVMWYRACVWNNRAYRQLPTISNRGFARAVAINNRGEILVCCWEQGLWPLADNTPRAFAVWTDKSGLVPLAKLLPPDSPLKIRDVRGINDGSQIAATAVNRRGETRAVLIDPDPTFAPGKP